MCLSRYSTHLQSLLTPIEAKEATLRPRLLYPTLLSSTPPPSTPPHPSHPKPILYLTPDFASGKRRLYLTLPFLDGNQAHIGVSLSPVSLPASGSLSLWKVPTMPISEAWGSRWEEEVDLAQEPAGAGTGVTGLGQPLLRTRRLSCPGRVLSLEPLPTHQLVEVVL